MNKQQSFLPPFMLNPQSQSICDVVAPEMAQNLSGNLLMDEAQIFGGLYQQKMLEKIDRDDIMNSGRRGVKLFLLSAIVGSASNRLLTVARFGKFDFLNLRLIFRLVFRFGIFAVSFHQIFYNPMMNHVLKLRDYLNTKYIPRMRMYTQEMDPLIMNPLLLNEPGMTPDEKEYMKVFYENMKSQAAMMKAQMRMMEQENKKGKK
jgi:hypothetical protein